MDILKTVSSWLVGGLKSVIDLLPDNPFKLSVPPQIETILGYVNYFIPIRLMLITLAAWTACIVVWYAASVFMRWLKAIE